MSDGAAIHRANLVLVADVIERVDPAGAAEERADFAPRAVALSPLLTPEACRALPLAELADPTCLLRRSARATTHPSA